MNLFIYVLSVVSFTKIVFGASPVHDRNSLEAIYWEIKPFIFHDANGKLTGIIPDTFQRAHYYCSPSDSETGMLGFNSSRFLSHEDFHSAMLNESLESYKDVLRGVTKETAVWIPFISVVDVLWANRKGYHVFNLLKAERMAVIVRREEIEMTNKFLRGIGSLRAIMVIALLSAVIFAALIWLAERFSNDDFPQSFTRGISTSIWFCIVSMTTVGYGDVVVKTPIGRYIALHWLIFGVLLSSVFTATLTNAVSGIDDITIFGKKVVAIENSFEEKIAKHDYHAQVVPAKSYEEVFALVRAGKAYAGVMIENVTAWYQDEISAANEYDVPLSVIKTLPANIYIGLMVGKNVSDEVKKLFNCMLNLKEEIYDFAKDTYIRHLKLETTHVSHGLDLTRINLTVSIVLILATGLLVVGIVYDCFGLLKRFANDGGFMSYVRWILGREKLDVAASDSDSDAENVVTLSMIPRKSIFYFARGTEPNSSQNEAGRETDRTR